MDGVNPKVVDYVCPNLQFCWRNSSQFQLFPKLSLLYTFS